MELQSNVIFFVEIIGTVAFASSGAMVAVRKKLDLFGIIVLGVITAVGGGMLRDLMIGNIPPNMFRNPVYVFAAFLTVIVLFVLFRLRPSLLGGRYIEQYEKIMNILDAIGLGAFTVTGIDTGVEAGYGSYHFLIIFLGVITGIGGGILRDIMAGETPYVLKKTYLRLCIHRRRLSVHLFSGIHPLRSGHGCKRPSGNRHPDARQPLPVGSAENQN